MAEKDSTTKALEELDSFLKFLEEGDTPTAYNLLRKMNFHLVKRFYKEKFPSDSKEMAIINCVSVIRESLEIEAEYRAWKATARGRKRRS